MARGETWHEAAAEMWRKLHLAVDASCGMIVAQTLTDQDADDPSQVAPLLDQIDGRIVRVTADGAYDGAPTYQTIAAHGDGVDVVIPPRSTAVPSADPGPPTQRDRHLAMITEWGRLAWQAATDYGQRALIETTMGRYKCAVLLAKTSTCATILRRYGLLGRPLQAQPTSAWQQVETGESRRGKAACWEKAASGEATWPAAVIASRAWSSLDWLNRRPEWVWAHR